MPSAPEPHEEDRSVRDALAAVNADEVLDDPDELENRPEQPPAATPDSPNPICPARRRALASRHPSARSGAADPGQIGRNAARV